MQRFRLMKIYVVSVLVVLIVAIIGMAWLGQSQAAVSNTGTDPTQTALDNRLVQPRTTGGEIVK